MAIDENLLSTKMGLAMLISYFLCAAIMSYNHQHLAYNRLCRFTSFEGKKILEIGGHQSAESAQPFLQGGAAEVIVSGLNHVHPDIAPPYDNVKLMRVDAHELKKIFGASSFDIIYGLSILEHIPMLPNFLEQVFYALKPGGFAFFEGDPIWTSPKGHHVWVQAPGANYYFSQPSNPVPPWGHLLLNSSEMNSYLLGKEIPEDHARRVCDYIYASKEITRTTHGDISTSFSNCPLVVLSQITNSMEIPSEIHRDLRNRYGDENDYGVSAIQYVLHKPR